MIKVKEYFYNSFIEKLIEDKYELLYTDEFGYYRIYKGNIMVGKLQTWNKVLIYYLGQAQIEFINDLIIKYNSYLEFYEK